MMLLGYMYVTHWKISFSSLYHCLHHQFLADRASTQYDRLLESSCCPSVDTENHACIVL